MYIPFANWGDSDHQEIVKARRLSVLNSFGK